MKDLKAEQKKLLKEIAEAEKFLKKAKKDYEKLIAPPNKHIDAINKRLVEINNINFKALEPKQKALAIAKDAIANLDAQVFYAQVGTGYLNISDIDDDVNIKNAMSTCTINDDNCQVCALGGLMLSHIKFNNGTTIGDVADMGQSDITESLGEYFDEETLALVETAFEGTYLSNGVDEGMGSEISEFVENYEDYNCHDIDPKFKKAMEKAVNFTDSVHANERLRKIMENIVKNKGTFIP